jgi:hypothetical protein
MQTGCGQDADKKPQANSAGECELSSLALAFAQLPLARAQLSLLSLPEFLSLSLAPSLEQG